MVPYSDAVLTSDATSEPGDPVPPCGNGSRGKTVWYRLTAPGAGTITLDTFDSDYDTILSAYDGACDQLTALPGACNDDDPRDGAQSQVTVQAAAGATMLFMVSAFHDDGGNLMLAARFQLAPLCAGDCDDNGLLTVSECDVCSRIRGGDPLALCPPCDGNGDGLVDDGEVTRCRAGVEGCIRCLGDCDGSGAVTASDVVAAIGIVAHCPCSGGPGGNAIGCPTLPTGITSCLSADRDGDRCLSAPELALLASSIFRCSP